MKERMIPAMCPHCHHEFQIKRDTFIIPDINTVIVERLKDRTYFSHLCSNCHQLFYLMYPFMVRNPNKKYCLILSDKKDVDILSDDERVIIVKTVESFYLAFALLEDELNIEFVLKKKKQLERKLNASVQYDSYDAYNHCLWFEVKNELKALRLSKEEEKQIKMLYNASN